MLLFTIATLIPIPLFLAGAFLGGFWALGALVYMTLFVFLMDEVVALATRGQAEGDEFPAAERLSMVLAGAHFGLLILAVAALAGWTGLGWGARIALFLGFGMFFGQVSNSNAHELIHRTDKRMFRLGMWVYISLLFGHHTSAHRHVHHRYVATPEDPNSAVLGDSFYVFAPHAWWGSFTAGAEVETALRKNLGREKPKARSLHPYVLYVGGGLAIAVAMALVFGFGGLIAYLLLAFYAQMQLLLSDYVQHYGLERARLPGGRSEPVGPGHSWNSGHWYSSALMLNAPRHSDHHAHPARPYPALQLPPPTVAPRLPYSLPVMGAVALYPPAWFRMMDKRVEGWRAHTGQGAGVVRTEARARTKACPEPAPKTAPEAPAARTLSVVPESHAKAAPATAPKAGPAAPAPEPTPVVAAPELTPDPEPEPAPAAASGAVPSDDEVAAAVALTMAFAKEAAWEQPAAVEGAAAPRRRRGLMGRRKAR